MTPITAFVDSLLQPGVGHGPERGLDARARAWLESACSEVASGLPHAEFAARIALASRYVPRRGTVVLAPAQRAAADELLPGWNPERWGLLEAARARLVLARRDLEARSCVDALELTFTYADIGEACALYKAIVLLPGPERFVWRMGEGCRSSMRAIFEAVACDSPYPFRHFDALAWRQMVIKALFVEAPLWRVHGLDLRLDAELARMALDLAEERRSAGRPVQPELWLALGKHAGERGLASLQKELENGPDRGRAAAAFGLARAGALDPLLKARSREASPQVQSAIDRALKGALSQTAFASLPA